ncbi:hypothetical protein [Bradyrhizobium sp. CCBAU 21362]|uniref:hypothetical protein n=1 Tax=Bradyrhizobium sp. CCBAU 21362 TaxID=1325082 RepID=UPI002304EBEA|nr:hypothetical protein [Bradyrhizobium sp. CCBAU 21362]
MNGFISWKLTAPDPFLSRCQSLCLLQLLWACGQRVSVVHHVHSLRGLHPFAPNRHRRAIAVRLMKATIVAEGDPARDPCLGLAAVGIALEMSSCLSDRHSRSMKTLQLHPGPGATLNDLLPILLARADGAAGGTALREIVDPIPVGEHDPCALNN